ncbi:MAG: mechanosensitive ion channel [Chloroflexi bacterium]|jgi:MscS family membrane protein|nr:mechanosensitive ion channel [Chloroflexota bacterium]MBT3671208.1 mechanosensitive ion channel [Chloroflexota bacterium]MBT4004378.1 mechanosensitive ion channel [Chloroflexota bacterium]MBT4304333.1 mechanosensitive ion channel [Chloroflexota bacterium]MBT4534352.1 mechanosensitive ion channel [Chloroflexota bacterium]
MGLFGLTNDQWIEIGISFAILVGTVIVGRPILNFILDRVVRRITKSTKTKLDDVLVKVVRPPLFWLLLLKVTQYAISRLDFIDFFKSSNIDDFFYTLYFLLVFALVWQLIVSLSSWYTKEIAPNTKSDLASQLLPFSRRVILIIVAIIGGIILLGHFDVEVSGLVTTLGIGSLAIALAAQAALSDTISGFMIMLDRPFRIGDRIEIQDLSTWGDVVDVGLRSTHIRTRDNRMVIVPNSVIAKSLIVNHAYPNSEYRIQIEVGIGYGTDIEKARETIIGAVRTVEGVVPEKPVEALFLNFGDSALLFRVRWWIDSYIDTRQMFDKVNSAIYKALGRENIEVPFPQQDVHLHIDAEGLKKFNELNDK